MIKKKNLHIWALATLFGLPAYFLNSQVLAESGDEDSNIVFITETKDIDDYQYAYEARKNTTSIMLLGVMGASSKTSNIPHYAPSLPHFFDTHLKSAKNGLRSRFKDEKFDIYAGDKSFFSEDMNRGISVESAKLAGLAFDAGRWTLGGGYTWDEDNPAFLDKNDQGFILGASYNKDNWALQASYMATGDVFSFSSDSDHYNSYILGASYAPNEGIGYTTTLQFQQYNGDKTYIEDNEVRFTIGTKIKF